MKNSNKLMLAVFYGVLAGVYPICGSDLPEVKRLVENMPNKSQHDSIDSCRQENNDVRYPQVPLPIGIFVYLASETCDGTINRYFTKDYFSKSNAFSAYQLGLLTGLVPLYTPFTGLVAYAILTEKNSLNRPVVLGALATGMLTGVGCWYGLVKAVKHIA